MRALRILVHEDIHVFYVDLLHAYEFRLPSGARFAIPKENLDDMIEVFRLVKEHAENK